jgi:phage terminase large subunit-like protein
MRSASSARGVADLLDTIKVKHDSGGLSTIGLKSYLSGREKFQGETLHCVWLDEEPPADIYLEALTRTNIGSNPVYLTFTPLLGVSETVRRFLMEKSPDRSITSMTIDDVQHYSLEEKARIIANYPPHELEARTKGIPALGFRSGLPHTRGADSNRVARLPPVLAAHRWNGFRLGSPVCRGGTRLGSRR